MVSHSIKKSQASSFFDSIFQRRWLLDIQSFGLIVEYGVFGSSAYHSGPSQIHSHNSNRKLMV